MSLSSNRNVSYLSSTLRWPISLFLINYIRVTQTRDMPALRTENKDGRAAVSHVICLSFPSLVAWSRFNNSWGLTDSKTYKRMWWNASHVVEGFLWRARRLRGVTLFNCTQLTAPVCLQGHPAPSSGLKRLPLQRKYEYELLFAQL